MRALRMPSSSGAGGLVTAHVVSLFVVVVYVVFVHICSVCHYICSDLCYVLYVYGMFSSPPPRWTSPA